VEQRHKNIAAANIITFWCKPVSSSFDHRGETSI